MSRRISTSEVEARAAKVAAIYQAEIEQGNRAFPVIMQKLGISRATAGRWVREARRLGLLTATDEERPNRKLLAIAKEVGVEYAVLYAAVERHAAGDLRLTDRAAVR